MKLVEQHHMMSPLRLRATRSMSRAPLGIADARRTQRPFPPMEPRQLPSRADSTRVEYLAAIASTSSKFFAAIDSLT